jgi:hypothetical protein
MQENEERRMQENEERRMLQAVGAALSALVGEFSFWVSFWS